MLPIVSLPELIFPETPIIISYNKWLLTKPGNTTYEIGNVTSNLKLEKIFGERGINQKLKSTTPQYGLLLRTYNSDLYQNWINYMTNVNEVRGNFAVSNNEMFMTLNRKYEPELRLHF